MSIVLVIALGGPLVACVLALARERRLRKALEKLLRTILSRWRKDVHKTDSDDRNYRADHFHDRRLHD
jgi:hypothetical protein